jgi:APA family basic amino acid/polyamine antiporter
MNNKPQLVRSLGLTTAILLVISSMIGSGVFKKIAPMSATLLDSNLVLLAWVLAGVVSMMGVFTYAGLSSLTEEGGGQFEYFRIIYGRFFGYLFGWACFTVIQSASIASIAYVFSQSVNNIFHLGDPFAQWSETSIAGTLTPFENSGVKLFAIATIVALTIINYFGVKKGGMLNDIFSAAKITGIVFLIVAGLILHGTVTEDPTITLASPPQGVSLLSAMFGAMLAAFWAYDGWINVSYIGGEIKNPKKNIPIAIIGGTAVVMLLYVLVNYVYLHVLPVSTFVAIDASQNKIAAAEVAQQLLPGFGYVLISVLIMICTFGATNASLMSSPRIYHQMAKKDLFFKSFGETHPKYHTPHVSLVYQMIWSSILVISGTFDQLTDMLIFASFIAYGSGAAGLLYMKYKGKQIRQPDGTMQHVRITTKVIGFPVIPIVFLIFCVGLVANTLYVYRQESLTGLGFIALGIPLYFLFRKKSESEQQQIDQVN